MILNAVILIFAYDHCIKKPKIEREVFDRRDHMQRNPFSFPVIRSEDHVKSLKCQIEAKEFLARLISSLSSISGK